MEKMHQVSFGLTDETIRLEQQSGLDEPDVIHLHPEQLKFITRRLTGMKEASAVQVAELERRLSVLTAGLAEFVCDSSIRSEMLDNCPAEFDFIERLDGLLNLAWEFSDNPLSPDDMRRPQAEPTGAPKDPPYVTASPSADNSTKRDNDIQLGLDV